jgi:HlyD family secretion protein
MNTSLFRQVSLQRLSSPEQLDQVLRVTSPKSWTALVAVFLLLIAAIVWGFWGSIVTTATGQGVIVRTGGVLNVVTRGGGLVLNLNVKTGEKVKASQVVATIAQPVLAEKIRGIRQALAEATEERARTWKLHSDAARLQVDAIQRQQANAERQIAEVEERVKLAKDQLVAEEQLYAKGLITKQQAVVANEKVIGLQDQIAALHAQIKQLDAQKFSAQSQTQQEDTEMQNRISSLQRDLEGAEKELSLAENVVSPYDGDVLEVKVYQGATVAMGEPILSVQPEQHDLELLGYLPSPEAKDAKVGMEVQVSPSTIKREEFGFMRGEVMYISDYPATPASITRNFENESLAKSLSGTGPVTEVRILLHRDPSTPSGFKWSASKGPSILMSSGTICSLQVVTNRERPVSLVFPFLKKTFGLS